MTQLSVKFAIFDAVDTTWAALFAEAAAFATTIPRDRLITITVTINYCGRGVATVWYWE